MEALSILKTILFVISIVVFCLLFIALVQVRQDDVLVQGKPLPAWLHDARHQDDTIRYKALEVLVYVLKNDPDSINRSCAAHALFAASPDNLEAVDALVHALNDDNPHVREGAAWALATVRPQSKDVAKALIRLFDDNEIKVRHAAESALEGQNHLDIDLLPILIAKLKHSDAGVRSTSAALLGNMGKDAAPAIPHLHECARDPFEWVSEAAQRAVEKIIGALENNRKTKGDADL